MALENLIPSAPNGNLVKWALAIAAFAIIIFVADQYFGGGNLFGFKKPKVKTYPRDMVGGAVKPPQA